MHYLIYKVTNLINNKIYIGAHKTENIDDNYMGSGKYIKLAIKKYGKENFKREILFILDSPSDMYKKEKEIVNEEFIKRYDTYNCKVGGRGGMTAFMTDEEKDVFVKNMSKIKKSQYDDGMQTWNKGLKMTDEFRSKISESLKGKHAGENNPMYGKPCYYKMTDDEKQTWSEGIRKGNTGKIRTTEHKKNYSSAASKRKWLVHRDGTVTHTMDENDFRLNHPDWQNGKKWKNK
jgi:Ni/Co efflux regulator RcnB